MSSHNPVRTCIGCRQRVAAAELLRVVVAPGSTSTADAAPIVPDPRRRLPGRGAWLHASSSCLDLAARRRAFARALRTSGNIDPAALGEYLSQAEHSTTGQYSKMARNGIAAESLQTTEHTPPAEPRRR